MSLVLVLASCRPDPEDRELELLPDMYRNPAVKAQEEYDFFRGNIGSVVPPAGAIPVDFTPYPYGITEGELAGEELVNPLPMSREVLEIGRKYYNIHCTVCHGPVGGGDGLATIAKRENGMPIPPALYTQKIRDWKDGQLYHTITLGQGQMPAYAARIEPVHRWAIVHYVRALGEAANPTEQDIEAVERLGWDAKQMDSPLRDQNPEEMLKKQSIFRLDYQP
jgi:mono/diheme cytochrome c family protein